jgi:hypothetical protein
MKFFLFAILVIGIQIPSWASSGVAPFWLYQASDGKFVVRMSDKAEQDDSSGVTSGAVKSKLFVYKMLNGNIAKKQTFVTSTICESYRSDPKSIKCESASGPFSGAAYKLSSVYTLEQAGKGRLKPKIVLGRNDQTQNHSAMLLIGEYMKSKEYKASFGLASYGIFNCVEGCKTQGTPELMIQVNLMGD